MNVQALGSAAAELLEQPSTAVVQGSTRQGVFLRLDTGWVIFLSREVECGPLTLNITGEAGHLNSLAIGDKYKVATLGIYPDQSFIASRQSMSPDNLPASMGLPAVQRIPTRNDNEQGSLLLEIDQAKVWSAPPRPADVLPATERVLLITATIKQALNIRPTASLNALQAILGGNIRMPEGEAGHFYSHLVGIHTQLVSRQRSTSEAVSSPLRQLDPHTFSPLLGLGRGLTPTGDDILLGMLLALNRWRSVLAPRLDVGLLNRDILALAYQHTTTISANLIECAARGQADERLITALDGLVTGAPGPAQAAGLLADWGSSSGLDALCGMALVIVGAQG